MKPTRRIVVATATAGLGLALSLGSAGAAFADGPNTDKSTVRTIQAQQWPTFGVGQEDYRIAVFRCYLKFYHYDFDSCDFSAQQKLTPYMSRILEDFQYEHDIARTGKLDPASWEAMSKEIGIVKPGDNRKRIVQAVQYTMQHHGATTLKADGSYGKKTAAAVKHFQQAHHIDADGRFGPISYRAAYTGS